MLSLWLEALTMGHVWSWWCLFLRVTVLEKWFYEPACIFLVGRRLAPFDVFVPVLAKENAQAGCFSRPLCLWNYQCFIIMWTYRVMRCTFCCVFKLTNQILCICNPIDWPWRRNGLKMYAPCETISFVSWWLGNGIHDSLVQLEIEDFFFNLAFLEQL